MVKNERTKSSKLSAKTSSAEAMIAGHSSGSVTSRSVWIRVAPRSSAASSTSWCIDASRARTITVTKEIEKVMWAIITVPSDSARPICAKKTSAATPATISGTTSGTNIRTFEERAIRPRARTRP